ncbi:hypothetical protein LUZ63_009704 [Rhynchospora breviuscula]|uniref:Uncharacterized protein n=1 Tax=Rhynchospora breviuscula TaxID=2022672 RepID=A0A9Q0CFK4_9POAL|nr:hypothetical protein LUZ63_009704 [Rhynchospora breviuscula]
MEENRRSTAGMEEEERGAAASALIGPSRRSLRRWSRPAPYSPSPRRFVSDFLSKPSPPIRSLLDTPRFSLPPLHENARVTTLERSQIPGNPTQELERKHELDAIDDSEFGKIEQYLKTGSFSRDEAEHLLEVIRSRTPALSKAGALSITKSPTSVRTESKQFGSLAPTTITWKPGDSVYSKANALGCTPIDIAKAYMRDLSSSRADSGYKTRTSKDADNSSEKNDSSTKLRICWPGSTSSGNNNSCITPQSSKGNTVQGATTALTPYSDSHFSRSTFKVKSDRDSYDLFSSGKKRRLTTLDGMKRQKQKLEDETTFRFFDPEANTENALMTFTQKGTYPINRQQKITHSSQGEGKDVEAVSGAGSLLVKSTERAQKILSLLDRASQSPLEKAPLQKQISREIPPRSLPLKNKKQESFQGIGRSNQKMPDVNMDGDASKPDATMTKKNADMVGLGFTFPVPALNTVSTEPPPTPTMPSPPARLVSGDLPSVPTFSFGSPSSSSSRLVFSFDSIENSSTILDEPLPIFKFGSEEKRLSFSFAEKGAVCF